MSEHKIEEATKVVYCWYYHNAMSMDRIEWIQDKILQHDWEAFNIVKDLYDADNSPYKLSTKGKPMIYFPDYVFAYYNDDTPIEIPLSEEAFRCITLVDHENG